MKSPSLIGEMVFHRKVKHFPFLTKASRGQDTNKKDPQRGRKQYKVHSTPQALRIQIKKTPRGDGNSLSKRYKKFNQSAYKYPPHRGRFFALCAILK